MIRFEVADVSYGPEEFERLREEMIELRNAALEQGDFGWGVKLSHLVGVMAAVKVHVWPEASREG